MSKSNTPLTDDCVIVLKSKDALVDDMEVVPASLSRRLEAELKDLKDKINDWRNLNNSQLRLRCGELTADEIRSIKAVLNAIMHKP